MTSRRCKATERLSLVRRVGLWQSSASLARIKAAGSWYGGGSLETVTEKAILSSIRVRLITTGLNLCRERKTHFGIEPILNRRK